MRPLTFHTLILAIPFSLQSATTQASPPRWQQSESSVALLQGQEVLWQFKDFKTLGNAVSNSVVLDAPDGVRR